MVVLSERLTAHLDRNWREDLEPVWRGFFEGVDPDLGELSDWETPDLFPDRLELGHPREVEDPVPVRHMLHAFDGLTPDRVQVVILGQDPYTQRARATGRAFDDGEWDEDNPAAVAKSLRRLLQSAAADAHPNLGISEDYDDWDRVRHAIEAGIIAPPAVPNFFDALAAQGVLSVNAAWTFTGTAKAEKVAHLRVWKPVMTHLLRQLTWRGGNPIVFMLLGDDARALFRRAVGSHFRQDAIDGATRLATVYSDHPASLGSVPAGGRMTP